MESPRTSIRKETSGSEEPVPAFQGSIHAPALRFHARTAGVVGQLWNRRIPLLPDDRRCIMAVRRERDIGNIDHESDIVRYCNHRLYSLHQQYRVAVFYSEPGP